MSPVELELLNRAENSEHTSALRASEPPLGPGLDAALDAGLKASAWQGELFGLFLRHSPIYAYVKEVTATESRVLRVSDNLVRLTGIPAAEMVGRTMEELFPPAFAAEMTAADWAVVSSRQELKLEEVLDGRTYTTLKFPLIIGERTLLAGYTIDITERREAEKARLELERQLMLAKKRESLSVMAGGVAHQLNNLLAIIRGNIELARAGASPAVDELLAEAEGAIQQTSDISGSLLSYLGQGQYHRSPRHLGREVSALLPRLRVGLPSEVRLTLEVAGDLPVCKIDPSELQGVVVNLVTNAWEAAGPDGCVVRIAARRAHTLPADAEVTTSAHGGAWACLEVSDDGPGMDGETRERMFEPFFTTKVLGRGLGLPVAQGIVRACGGAIAVESALGHGTTVRVYLPECTKAERQATPWPPIVRVRSVPSGARAPGGAVLLVDDDPAVLRASQRMLQWLGREVLAVESGVEALAVFAAKADTIGGVLLDLSMPGMDGWQVLTALRQRRAGMFVVVASGYDLARLRRETRSEQPDGWLQKPYPIGELAAIFGSTRADQKSH